MTPRPALLAAGALLAVMIGVGLVARHTSTGDLRDRIIHGLETVSERRVTLREVSYSPSRGLAVQLDGLVIHAAHDQGPPLLEADRVVVGVGLGFVLGRDIKVATVDLIGVRATIDLYPGRDLLERAQRTAQRSDRHLSQLLGLGITDLDIGRVSLRDGVVTFLNHRDPTAPALILDHVQGQINQISARHASPLTASARLFATPFTVTGQLGPMPDSLDYHQVPMLLSVEAKTLDPAQFKELLPPAWRHGKVERSYFSSLIHGSLEEGLLTNTWLELDGFRPAGPHAPAGDKAIDLAMRQKSVLRVEEGETVLALEEGFLYLNGKPLVTAKGEWRQEEGSFLDFDLTLHQPVDLATLPLPPDLLPLQGRVGGGLRVWGQWPQPLTVETRLILDQATVRWAGWLDKAAGVPLLVTAHADWCQERLVLHDLLLDGGSDNRLHLDEVPGEPRAWSLWGSWQGERLGPYFPWATGWKVKSTLSLAARLEAGEAGSPVLSGQAQTGELAWDAWKLGQSELHFSWQQGRLRVARFQTAVAGGVVSGSGELVMAPEPFYQAALQWQGVKLEGLALASLPWSALEGSLCGSGVVSGGLSPQGRPFVDELCATVEVGPGRLWGLSEAGFDQQGSHPFPRVEDSLAWERASGSLRWRAGRGELLRGRLFTASMDVLTEGQWHQEGAFRLRFIRPPEGWWEEPGEVLVKGDRAGAMVHQGVHAP